MEFMIKNGNPDAVVTLTEHEYAGRPGITLVDVDMTFPAPTVPKPVQIQWYVPERDIWSVISSSSLYERHVAPSWRKRVTSSRLASGAPMHQLLSATGKNRLTISLSDPKTPCEIATGAHERNGKMECEVRFFTAPINTITEYHAVIYLDTTDRRYDLSIKAAERYWAEDCGCPEAYIPDASRRAVYSCWYSFHQSIDVDAIVRQCELAKPLGMDTVIVDDGWQCDDVNGGYAWCGDWKAMPSKVPDMKAFVDRVHATGMKFVLWYSVPALGIHSEAYARFKDMVLNPSARSWCSLDPRFPQVREYLTGIYTDAVRNWGLDGMKLDFIDSFRLFPDTPAFDERWDTLSLEDGVEKLLDGVTSALRAINPDFMIEFRQSYFGPVIRHFGNMIRVGDCPNDSYRNHVSGIDLRFLLGGTPVHSDMLMWDPEEPAEAAAQQVISTLFTVPQISVMLDRISDDQRAMLAFYLKFWNDHRETLLDGELTADNPEQLYSLVRAKNDGEIIAVAYSKPILSVSKFRKVFFINSSDSEVLFLRSAADVGQRTAEILDCTGKTVEKQTIMLKHGLYEFRVPRSGMLMIG